MCSAVGDKVGALLEAFPTLDAFIRPLARMSSEVSYEIGAVVEALPTFCAHGLLSCVSVQELV